jgi:acyl-CoA reductase-like NAD-dependent aldehyde dehydrogenase
VQQAIDLANDSSYGLSASVWTSDPALAQEVAKALEAGTVMVNKHADRTPHLPMAGAKQSGVGVELGVHGLHEFTQLKVINTARGT